MSDLERKVMDLGRLVLGGNVVFCLDAEHVLDAIMDKLAAVPVAEAGTVTGDEKTLESILARVDELASDARSLKYHIEDIARARVKKVA